MDATLPVTFSGHGPAPLSVNGFTCSRDIAHVLSDEVRGRRASSQHSELRSGRIYALLLRPTNTQVGA